MSHCERSEAISWDCHVASAPRNDYFSKSFTINGPLPRLRARVFRFGTSLIGKPKTFSNKAHSGRSGP
jgi:hypothetical protein